MSNFRVNDDDTLRQQLAGVAALLNEERVARLMLHIGGDTATRTTRATARTTTTNAFDRLLTWLLTKLNNNDNDDDNDGAANALRAALLATGIDRATVDGVVNNVNWQVCVARLRFFFCFSRSTPTRCVLNRQFETNSSQTAAVAHCRHANASMTAARRLLETLVRGWNKIFSPQNKLF